jgi:precorrin-2/cobalt-factor-2 C20-methyltransferase
MRNRSIQKNNALQTEQKATFYGVGVGTGDPELLTLKAVRIIESVDIVYYLKTATGHTLARDIAQQHLGHQQEFSIDMPAMQIERSQINKAYDSAAEQISVYLQNGKSVAFLCEGDPFFFGSYIYLYQRLQPQFDCHTVAGISSIHASAALAGIPLVQQNDNLVVLSSRNSDQEILQALQQFASVVIMKVGKHRARLCALIHTAQRVKDSCYIERVGQAGERVQYNINELDTSVGEYFSLFLVIKSHQSPQ